MRGCLQVAVAVVRHAGGRGSRETRAERLAKGAHDAWGVGDACGSGLLLLVAVDDRQVSITPLARGHPTICAAHAPLFASPRPQAFVSTGASAAAAAPDAALELVLDRMRPLLRDGALDAALLGAARDLGEVLAGRLAPRTPYLAWFVFILAVAAVLLYQRWAAERKARAYRDVMRTLCVPLIAECMYPIACSR